MRVSVRNAIVVATGAMGSFDEGQRRGVLARPLAGRALLRRGYMLMLIVGTTWIDLTLLVRYTVASLEQGRPVDNKSNLLMGRSLEGRVTCLVQADRLRRVQVYIGRNRSSQFASIHAHLSK